MLRRKAHITIDDAVRIIKCMVNEDRLEGYWEDPEGYIIRLYPTTKIGGYCENLLFYISDKGGVSVTNPMEKPIIMSSPMTRFEKDPFKHI